jgi:hypothetical protein
MLHAQCFTPKAFPRQAYVATTVDLPRLAAASPTA